MTRARLWTASASLAVLLVLLGGSPSDGPSLSAQVAVTAHPALPGTASDLWLVPPASESSPQTIAVYKPLIDAAAAFNAGDYAAALPLASSASLATTELRDYATYYAAASQLRLSRSGDARALFRTLRGRKPPGHLGIVSAIGEAEAAEALGDYKAAFSIYEDLVDSKSAVSDDVLSRMARAALGAKDRKKAAEGYLRVYYEFPLTESSIAAEAQLDTLRDVMVRVGFKADLGRAQILFGARRYPEARAAFAAVQRNVSGDERELVDLRLAECDFFLKRYLAAQEGARPYLESGARRAEARFFYLSAQRELGQSAAYVAATRALVDEFPDSSWSEEALNNLGTAYIRTSQDDLAAATFRELYEKFPAGPRAERAAWKYGWYQYRSGAHAETVRVFESAATTFTRSDYRPSFLYWAARSHGKIGNGAATEDRLRVVRADYGNSYYGRMATERLRPASAAASPVSAARQTLAAAAAPALPTERLIRTLLAVNLYDDALNELRFAQRAWGPSTPVDATIAWVYHRKGDLRRAITLMRRAYPQHLTSWGQTVPAEILQVIFPLTYWDSIRKHSAAKSLDPYLIAALIAQESTFDPDIRSVADAWGLMQILPSTGRRLARDVGVTRFTTPVLTNAEINIRMGTLYFSRLVQQFGGTHFALASYNAGENRVVRWRAERPGLDQDEFIDDIPFPETQNYVKRILGTAEDYRMLYGKGKGRPIPVPDSADESPAAPVAAALSRTPVTPSTVKKPATIKTPPARKPAASAKKPASKQPAAKKKSVARAR